MKSKAPIVLIGLILLAQGALYLAVGAEGVARILQEIAGGIGVHYNTLLVLLGTGLLGIAAGVVGSRSA